MADPLFYENARNALAAEPYALSRREPPHLWVRVPRGDWIILSPEEHQLPSQGWKVHVSGRLENAERIIEAVWAYCIRRHVPFKFLSSPRLVLARNAKYAGRGGSGKLVTIYPRDEAELQLVCEDLDAALTGEPGPSILSDLRWGAGPVHVRYGGFTPRYCADERGEQILAIEGPDGTLVPDVRGPVFAVPPWVTLPACLEPHLAVRNAAVLSDLPYTIEEALHFSNGGGVYGGVDRRSGDPVVLKEARPHAGLSGDGTDALTRLRRERDTLTRLAGLEGVPRLLDHVAVADHEFLVMERVDGQALNAALTQRCPLLGATAGDDALDEYTRWAIGIHDEITRVVAAIHERGVVYGDLHMFNVIVRPDDRVCLIDFEVADDAGSDRRPVLGAAGYVAPDRTGFDLDRHALACLKLALFLPLERLLGLDRSKARHLADIIADTFPVPRAWLDEAVGVVTGPARSAGAGPAGAVAAGAGPVGAVVAGAVTAGAGPEATAGTRHGDGGGRPPVPATALAPDHWTLEPTPTGWERARQALTRAILASATPQRDDRLFPGDILQFQPGGGLTVAHGAAGVLYALDVTGAGRFPAHEDWLVRQARQPDPEAHRGFYDGLHGVAHVLAHLGHTEDAVKVVDACLDGPWEHAGNSLYSGLAGIGLNLAHLADLTGDPALHDATRRATDLVGDRLGPVDAVADVSGNGHPYAGLMRGSAGPALLFVRMFERTGDPGLLDLAATALQQDLRRCVAVGSGPGGDGAWRLHVNEGSRTLPYIDLGSAGIGLVIDRYLAHRHDDELAAAASAIRAAATALFYIQAGLFNGRAGMVLTLTDGRSPGAPPSPEIAAQVRRLAWHALSFQDGLAFPGDQLLRLSMDLATGSAGVLLALGAALHDAPVHLPFLGPARPRHTGPPGRPTHDPKERR